MFIENSNDKMTVHVTYWAGRRASAKQQNNYRRIRLSVVWLLLSVKSFVTGDGSWRQNFFARVARCAARLPSREVSGKSQPYQLIIGDRQVGVN